MINENGARLYCREDISLIENYDKAINDESQTWHCHHRDEVKTLPSGIRVVRSREELKENGRYYKCPANELIFLTNSEHRKLHNKDNKFGLGGTGFRGKHHTEEVRKKISESHKRESLSEETLKKMSEAQKGNKNGIGNKNRLGKHNSVEHRRKISDALISSEFGTKFKEHYGISKRDDVRLYSKENDWYRRHNKTCRWEKEA